MDAAAYAQRWANLNDVAGTVAASLKGAQALTEDDLTVVGDAYQAFTATHTVSLDQLQAVAGSAILADNHQAVASLVQANWDQSKSISDYMTNNVSRGDRRFNDKASALDASFSKAMAAL